MQFRGTQLQVHVSVNNGCKQPCSILLILIEGSQHSEREEYEWNMLTIQFQEVEISEK